MIKKGKNWIKARCKTSYAQGFIDSIEYFSSIRLLKTQVDFHGYTILPDSTILSKNGRPLKKQLRERRGGKFDHCVVLYYDGKARKHTVQRLILAAFDGPMEGYEGNHLNRDTLDNRLPNLGRATPSENQRHWRNSEKENVDESA